MEIVSGVLGLLVAIWIVKLLILVLYVATLVRQARKNQWIWFVITLLVSPLFVLYWICRLFRIVK